MKKDVSFDSSFLYQKKGIVILFIFWLTKFQKFFIIFKLHMYYEKSTFGADIS